MKQTIKTIIRNVKSIKGNSLAEFATTTALMATLAATAAPKLSEMSEGTKAEKSRNEIDKIIKQFSNLENFRNNLDNGMSSKLGEFGSKISGGQLQRIGLARAIYKNSQLIILDESLSNVDYETKEKILQRCTISFFNNKG